MRPPHLQRKCNPGRFQTNNVPWIKGKKCERDSNKVRRSGVRLSSTEFETCFRESHGRYIAVADTGEEGPGILLRPKSTLSDKYLDELAADHSMKGDLQTNQFVHMQKVIDMFNDCFTEHMETQPGCNGNLTIAKKHKWGIVCRVSLKCTQCAYISKMHSLYDEVAGSSRGRRAATANRGVHVGLMETPISGDGLQSILNAINSPSPCLSGLQKNATLVGKRIIDLNKKDMMNVREGLLNMNEALGKARDAPIMAAADSQYNNPLFSGGGRKAGQPGTQSSFTVMETMTTKNKVISVKTTNKLCRKKNCDHKDCSKNLPSSAVIGDEGRSARACAKDLASGSAPISIKFLTTDGDSQGYKGFKKGQVDYGKNHVFMENLRDIRHLNCSMKRALNKVEFSDDMFGPGLTKVTRKQYQRHLGYDVAERCSAELILLHAKHDQGEGDLEKIVKDASFIMHAITQCYQNCGTLCKQYSNVCCGGIKGWQTHSSYLSTRAGKIEMTYMDKQEFHAVLRMRMSRNAIIMTRKNTHTQAVEAIHRGYIAVNPKAVTRSVNFAPRIHSAIHKHNRGRGTSMALKLQCVEAPVAQSSTVAQQLKARDKKGKLDTVRQRSLKYKTGRKIRRQSEYQEYEKTRGLRKKESETYRKGMHDQRAQRSKVRDDHAYHRLAETAAETETDSSTTEEDEISDVSDY